MRSRLEEEWSALPTSWKDRLPTVLNEPWFRELGIFLDAELARERGGGPRIFPPEGLWLRALREVPFESIRAVILGQDPYHGAGQAIGASFAVPNSLRPRPPSLVNIFKEVASDLQRPLDPACSDLSGWMAQGVLLLNTALTVREGEPLSHRDRGWENSRMRSSAP